MDYNDFKSYEDCCKALGVAPELPDGLTPGEIADRKVYRICKAIKNSAKTDWMATSIMKYYVVMKFDPSVGRFRFDSVCGDFVTSDAGAGSRLALPDFESARFAGKMFEQEFSDQLMAEHEEA
jgi:hypothetical protein